MNKSILFIILLVVAGGIMVVVDYSSSRTPPKKDETGGGIVQEPEVMRDFRGFCDSLSESRWDKAAFQERIDRLNVYRAQDILNVSAFLNLEQYMYSAYAASLINSYTEWKQSCDAAKLRPLLAEMKRISGVNSECSSKLSSSQREIDGFYLLQGMPTKVELFTSGAFSEIQFNQLKQQVSALPRDFSGCSNVNRVKQGAENELNTFSMFVVNFNDATSAYLVNPTDDYTLRDLKKLCGEAKANNYSYYVSQLNEKNVCY
jgi:hypothetical protein